MTKNWAIITFADKEPYISETKNIEKLSHSVGINFRRYDDEWVKKTEFYKNNTKLFANKKFGFCAWKPLIILDALKTYDKVLYLDSSMLFIPSKIIEYFEEHDFIMSTITPLQNKLYTNRRTFDIMRCEDRGYFDEYQAWAGTILANRSAQELLEEYLYYCSIEDCVSDRVDPQNDFGFRYHLYDQSIYSLLLVKYGVTLVENDIPFLDLREPGHLGYIEKLLGKEFLGVQKMLIANYWNVYENNFSGCPINLYFAKEIEAQRMLV
jgi:hypothetical protein